jgi:nifR3 family TIM-barrel protein
MNFNPAEAAAKGEPFPAGDPYGAAGAGPEKLRIRTLEIDPPLLLAPMAGVTHTALRRLVAGYGGCGAFYTEMLSARALPNETPERSFYLFRSAVENPLIYQIVAGDEERIPPAAAVVERLGADAVDLNMGCAAPAILRQGAGAALMRAPDRARRMVERLRRTTGLPLFVKLRIGWKPDPKELVGFCRGLEEAGADALVVHARLCADRFKRPVRRWFVREVRENVGIPVIANGDVTNVRAAREYFVETGCNAVMVGRAAVSRPWIFRDIRAALWEGREPASPPAPVGVYDRYVELLRDCLPEERRLGRLKEFTAYFARNFAFGHELWRAVQASRDLEQCRRRASRFFKDLEKEPLFGYRAELPLEIGRHGG